MEGGKSCIPRRACYRTDGFAGQAAAGWRLSGFWREESPVSIGQRAG